VSTLRWVSGHRKPGMYEFVRAYPVFLTLQAKNAHSPSKGPTPNLSNSHRTLQQPWWTRCGEMCFSGFDLYCNTSALVSWCKPNAFVNKTVARQ
jgi:hypothetical protein